MMNVHRLISGLVLGAALCVGPAVLAQGGLTGQISGTVVDSSQAALPGAVVVLTNENTRATREVVTDDRGNFVAANLMAGTYKVHASLTGFTAIETGGIVLTAQQRLALPALALSVGAISETVQVAGIAPLVQTTSAERSAVMTFDEVEDVGLRGRDFMGALKTLPGVIDTSMRDAPGWGSVGNMTINGRSSFNFSYDGIVSKDTGSNSGNYVAPGLDSIGEIRVQASNFQAEYGRSAGASITVITKSGTNAFHGSAAYYKRSEKFNANTFDRNRDCAAAPVKGGLPNPNCSKAPYRFDNSAWTLGGPIKRNRLFFFFSQDLLPRNDPGNLSLKTMATERERRGDFSETVDSLGRRLWIRDPQLAASGLACNVLTGGPGCFPGNVIPANRISAMGQRMLNLMPLPNSVDPSGDRQYNYTYQNELERPRNDQVTRIDWNVRPGTTFYTRLQFGNEVNARGQSALLGSSGNGGWPQFRTSYEILTYSTVNTLLHTVNPTTFIEAIVGQNFSRQRVAHADENALAANQRSHVLAGLPQFYPEVNPLDLVPNATFAGVNALPNLPSLSIEERYPYYAHNRTTNVVTNLTKMAGRHNLKFGVFFEHTARPSQRGGAFNGTYNFNADPANPLDTNLGFANALLGSINSYTESTWHGFGDAAYNQLEFFAQDNWRVTNRVTIDAGVRMYRLGSAYLTDDNFGGAQNSADQYYFNPAEFSASSAALLYQPVCPNNAATCAGNARLARNPVTGALLPNTYLNKLVPGSGDFYEGMVKYTGSPDKGWWGSPAARVGVAWDVTGNGRTAVRAGFGTFYDRLRDGYSVLGQLNPPFQERLQTLNTTIEQLLATPLVTSTRTGTAFLPGSFHAPTIHNWSVGVQRQLPFHLTADVAYVGNIGRFDATRYELNGVPYGTLRTDLNPQNADRTNNGQPINVDYLRPYRTYQSIIVEQTDGKSEYQSIQASMQRRMTNGLAWGFAYTGSVRRQFSGPAAGGGVILLNAYLCPNNAITCTKEENRDAIEAREYNRAGSRPHSLSINYNYNVPGLSSRLGNNAFSRAVFDGWQVSGVSVFQSGPWGTFGVAFTGAPFADMTGGPGGSRVALTCDPNLPRSERTFDRQFRTECISAPGPSTPGDTFYLGNAPGDEYLGLGYVNHDLTLFKNFAVGSGRTLQFRLEAYNVLNQTQYGTVNTNATFDFATGRQTNANFGKVTAARDGSNRTLQLGLRFTF